ncbi:hypothetical protein KGMB01110_18680 [Mediterraneibacter butyricigenes]|uniref:Uncharacterized protein n=1 Tax=Mediterraneibacter butyricigenes TaxID=2316025 RepID=A0A391PKQ2_9FIRM|nr:hypothetical protein KGMB01110_18680 [Mediterraneibacter butyricigenes]
MHEGSRQSRIREREILYEVGSDKGRKRHETLKIPHFSGVYGVHIHKDKKCLTA